MAPVTSTVRSEEKAGDGTRTSPPRAASCGSPETGPSEPPGVANRDSPETSPADTARPEAKSGDATRASRGTRTSPSRTASCGSSEASAAGTARYEASPRSRSSSTNRPGCSACADRRRPHTAAAARSGTSSAGSVATAPRVTTTSRESANRADASQLCTDRSTSLASSVFAAAETHSSKTVSGTSASASEAKSG